MDVTYTVTRRIAIDAGHRVMTHHSQCRHLHGHRYVIEATCSTISGHLHKVGYQADMVLDFGFLKEEMLKNIESPCDHGFIVAITDRTLLTILHPPSCSPGIWYQRLSVLVEQHGFYVTADNCLNTRLYVVPFQPTAEQLARHWFERLAPAVTSRSDGLATLILVSVWETPNNRADYKPDKPSL